MASHQEKPEIKWKIVPEETHPHLVTFVLDEDASSMGIIKASTKWDGCTHLWLPYDERVSHWHEEKLCYHHICDMDEFILYLQSVREKARAYFGGEFEVAPLNDQQYQEKITEIQSHIVNNADELIY